MVQCLPYPSALFLALVLSPTVCFLLMVCTRKEHSNRKASPDTVTAPTSSTSCVSVRTDQTKQQLSGSPELNQVTPSPVPTATIPTPVPIVSEYVAQPTPTATVPKGGAEPSTAVLMKNSTGTLGSFDTLNEATAYKPSLAYPLDWPRESNIKATPLEPISSDPLDRSYQLPVKKEVKRAQEIKKGKKVSRAAKEYDTQGSVDNTDFSENPFTQSTKVNKPEKAPRREIKVECKPVKKAAAPPSLPQLSSTQKSKIRLVPSSTQQSKSQPM